MPSIHDASNNLLARLTEADRFNEEQKAASPGLINEFQANGLNYSIIHNPAYKMVVPGAETKLNPAFYTAYAQRMNVNDPDESLVDTDSFDTLFESVAWIRNHIEKSLVSIFMPELF